MPNIFRSFLSSVVHHTAIFDVLIQRDFWKIKKIKNQKLKIIIGNLCPPFDLTGIAFPTSSSNLKTFDKKEKNYNHVNTLRTWETFWKKEAFFKIFKSFALVNTKIADRSFKNEQRLKEILSFRVFKMLWLIIVLPVKVPG